MFYVVIVFTVITTGGKKLVITGDYFGYKGARVTVGGKECEKTFHSVPMTGTCY